MQTNPAQVLAEDVATLVTRAGALWEGLRDARLFITGGTGFYGCWLLESLLHANQVHGLNASAVLLTRDATAFHARHPHLAQASAIHLHEGDIATFDFPEGPFTQVIHAASELSLASPPDPAGLIHTTLTGCRRVMALAAERGAQSVLYTSSGAIYGPMTAGRFHLAEDAALSALPLSPRGAYAEAKRLGEMICVLDGEAHGLQVKIARGFAFHGPYLPLDSHLAAASFLRSALRGEEIVIQGHGQTVRSYLYGADLAQWLWTILLQGTHARPYNLGSDVPVTIQALAEATIAACGSASTLRVLQHLRPGEEPDVYLPDISRARQELGLDVFTSLDEALHRTLRHHTAPR